MRTLGAMGFIFTSPEGEGRPAGPVWVNLDAMIHGMGAMRPLPTCFGMPTLPSGEGEKCIKRP